MKIIVIYYVTVNAVRTLLIKNV